MVATFLENRSSVIARDLKLNLKRILTEGSLSAEEGHLALLSLATSLGFNELALNARERLTGLGLPPEQIEEAAESPGLVGMLNVYYRFRHFLGSPDEYRIAGLRMTALARPAVGKEKFEMLAFALSVLNGCESCTKAHEKALRDAGTGTDKIHDLARLAAVVHGLSKL